MKTSKKVKSKASIQQMIKNGLLIGILYSIGYSCRTAERQVIALIFASEELKTKV